MKRRAFYIAMRAGVLAVFLFSPGSSAQGGGSVADVQFSISSIVFYPKVEYGHLSLTVSGNDLYKQQLFTPGDLIAFSTSLRDGGYKYEVVAIPQKDEEAWAAAAGNESEERLLYEQEAAKTFYQSGTFVVNMGQFSPVSNPSESE